MKFKVGDRVRVIDHQLGLCGFRCVYMIKEMKRLVGKEFTIEKVYPDISYDLKHIKHFTFSDCMLEKVSNNRGKNPRGPDGRYLPKDILDKRLSQLGVDMKEVDRMVWGFKLPKSLTINGVKYVQEEHV